MHILDHAVGGLGIPRITCDEYMTAILRRDGETMFLLQPCKLPLLFSPLGTTLTFCALVGSW
jgi:hypothetical protein